MKWYAISGTWKTITKEVEKDVRAVVKKIIEQGNGIITGGALGVDSIAIQTVLAFGDVKTQLRIYLPIKLERLRNHFLKRAREGVITMQQAEHVIRLWNTVAEQCTKCIRDDWEFNEANQESYYARTTNIIKDSDALYAFQVNDSPGTQDAIDKAKALGKQVIVKKYRLP